MSRIAVGLIFIFVVIVVTRIAPRSRVLPWLLALAYVGGIVFLAFLIRQPGDVGRINTVPFWALKRSVSLLGPNVFSGIKVINKVLLQDVILNVLLFIPFGILFPVLFRKTAALVFTVPAGFFASLCIETVQYITRLGTADVDDLINNTAGALLGLILYLVFVRRAVRKASEEL